jgi:transcriptional antiterminator
MKNLIIRCLIVKKEGKQMFTHRQLLILSFLLSDSFSFSSSFLSSILNVSERTIQLEVQEINKLLPDDGSFFYLTKRKGQTQNLTPETLAWLNQLIKENKEQNSSEFERKNLILLVLLFEKEYLSMEELSKRIYVSKTAIHKEMEQSWKLREFIEVSAQKGLKINRSEPEKRNLLAKLFNYDRSLNTLLKLPNDTQLIFEQVKTVTDRLFYEHQYFISGKSLALFQNYLVSTIIRNRKGFYLSEQEQQTAAKVELSSLLKEIIRELNLAVSKEDMSYIQVKLNELNVTNYTGEVTALSHYTFIKDKLATFYEAVDRELGITIQPTADWENKFIIHMHKLIIRLANGNDNDNYNKRKINQEYPLTLQVIRDYFEPIFGLAIPESEQAYLALYFAEFIEYEEQQLQLLFITDNLPSLIYRTKELIKEYSGYKITSIKNVTIYEYLRNPQRYEEHYFLLLTTSERVILESKRAFLIKDMPTKQDLQLLKEYFTMLLTHQNKEKRKWFETTYLHKTNKNSISEQQRINERTANTNQVITDEIVLEEPIIFITRFDKEIPSSINITQLKKKYKHRGKEIEFVIQSSYNPLEGQVQLFFSELKKMLTVKELKARIK